MNKLAEKHINQYGDFDVLTMIDDDPNGASIEIKDRRSGCYDSDLFEHKFMGRHNYLVELIEDADVNIVSTYFVKSQIHAVKVYDTIIQKRDVVWAYKYLFDLSKKSEIKFWKTHPNNNLPQDTRLQKRRALEQAEWIQRGIDEVEEYWTKDWNHRIDDNGNYKFGMW